MITLCGQSTFSSYDHVGAQRKAKMDKSTIGQKPQRINIKADKTTQKRKYFNTPTIKVYDPISGHDHMIQVWTINILLMRSRGLTEKSQNGLKHHRTNVPKDNYQSGQNPHKRQYFNTPTINVYDPTSGHVITITTGVYNQHSRHAITWADRQKP